MRSKRHRLNDCQTTWSLMNFTPRNQNYQRMMTVLCIPIFTELITINEIHTNLTNGSDLLHAQFQ